VSRLDGRAWISRGLIAVVIAWNLQAAISFLLHPQIYAPAFELSGVPGMAALRGVGVLFLMWNVPYLVACWQPRHQRVSLWEALVMQVLGVAGETVILLCLPPGHDALAGAILHFVLFDAAGVIALGTALVITTPSRQGNKNPAF
jgi:hypothetical protein